MKIAVVAAGAVGGYFGARLHAAGEEVYLVARGAHFDAIRRNGLVIETNDSAESITDVQVTDDPNEIGPVDIVLFAVKLWATEAAGQSVQPLIGANTAVISLQNGIDSVDILTPIFGAKHVIGGVAEIAAFVTQPGHIKLSSGFARMRFGEENGIASARMTAYYDACQRAGVDGILSNNIIKARWQKFVLLVGFSGMTALTRAPIGPILADPDMRDVYRTCMEEAVIVGLAAGAPLDPDYAAKCMEYSSAFQPGLKASMLGDLEQGGRLELDWLAGRVVSLGRELDVPTPVNETIYAGLKPFAGGAQNSV